MTKAKYIPYLLFLFFTANSYSQYNRVLNKDTINILHSKLFNFIEDNLDSLNTNNFRILKGGGGNVISLGIVRDSLSEKMFHYLIEEDRSFIRFMNSKTIDSSFKSWKNTKRKITFSSKISSKNKRRLDLGIFPFVRLESKIFLKITALSPGYDDDMYGTHIYIIFNDNMEIISVSIIEFFM